MLKRADYDRMLLAIGTRAFEGRGLVYTSWPERGWVYRPASVIDLTITFQGLSAPGPNYEVWAAIHRWDLPRVVDRVLDCPDDRRRCGDVGPFFHVFEKFGFHDFKNVSLFPPPVTFDVEPRFNWFFDCVVQRVLPWFDSLVPLENWLRLLASTRFPALGMPVYYAAGRFLAGSPIKRDELAQTFPWVDLSKLDPRYHAPLTLDQFLDRMLTSTPEAYRLASVSDWGAPPIVTSRPRKQK